MNRIPGLRLLISSLPGWAWRTHVESLDKPRDVNKRSRSLALPGKLDIKRHSPSILYLEKCSGSVVECLTRDRGVASSSLTEKLLTRT